MRHCLSLYSACLLLSVCSVSAQDTQPRLVIDAKGHAGFVTEVTYTPDGSHLITGCDDKLIRVWNVETGTIDKVFRHQQGDNFEGSLAKFGMSPDGRYLSFSTGTSVQSPAMFDVRIIDRQQGKVVALLRGHAAGVMVSKFSPDGQTLFTGDGAGQIRIWPLDAVYNHSGNQPLVVTDSVYLAGHNAGVGMLSMTADRSLLCSTDMNGQAFVWQQQPNGFYQGLGDLGQNSGTIAGALYSLDGKYIAGAARNGEIYLWGGDGTQLMALDSSQGQSVNCMEFSPDGTRLAVGVARDGARGGCTVDVYEIPTGKRVCRFDDQKSGTASLAWHPSGQAIACVGGDDNDIVIFNPVGDAGEVLQRIEGLGSGMWAVAISKDTSEGVKVAFGNRNDHTDSTHDADLDNQLHRIFDFSKMKLVEIEDPAAFGGFVRASLNHGGDTLAFNQDFSVSVSSGGVIAPVQGDSIRSFSFTSEGNVVSGSQFLLGLYSPNGQLVRNFPEQIGATFGVAPSPDGQYLATVSGDQALHLWNLKTGAKLASLFVSRNGEWVCWTPSGHYDASPGGEKFIGWHLNKPADQLSEFYPSYVFRDQFYKPGIVQATVSTGSVQEGLLAGAGKNQQAPKAEVDLTAMLPPEVSWILPATSRGDTQEDQVTLKTRIESKGTPLTEAKVLLNGKAVEAFYDVEGNSFELEHTLTLLPGENRLAIFAKNEASGFTSEERVLNFRAAGMEKPAEVASPGAKVEEEQLPPEMMPNLYLLSVGVSEYQNSDLTLSFCDDDAKAISRVFEGQKGKLFNKTEIKLLVDEDASRDGILEGLEWLQANATQKDVIILFLAAHGMNEGRNYYLVPWDGDFKSLRRTGVAWGDFADVLGNLPSKTLMFLDTCHSGQLGDNLYKFNTRGSKEQATDASEAIRELTSDENGVVVMAASTEGESSVEHPDWGHGAFTLALIEGLGGKADFIQDDVIQLRELDTYVAERVKELSEGIQHPTTVKPSSISRFPLIRVK